MLEQLQLAVIIICEGFAGFLKNAWDLQFSKRKRLAGRVYRKHGFQMTKFAKSIPVSVYLAVSYYEQIYDEAIVRHYDSTGLLNISHDVSYLFSMRIGVSW